MDEKEYIKAHKASLKEAVSFFGNKRKQEREIWVLETFLNYLPVDTSYSYIKGSNTEPNDVFYKNIGFQVKEVPSEGVKRGQEYKDELKSIDENTKLEDLLEPYTPIYMPLSDSLPRVTDELKRHRIEKYRNNTGDMNVLVYLNLCDTTFTAATVDTSAFNNELDHWLSVSLVTNNCAIVLSCKEERNNLLKPLEGKLYMGS